MSYKLSSLDREIDKWIRYPPPSAPLESLAFKLLAQVTPTFVLDCGAGNGRFSLQLAKNIQNVRVISLDMNKRMVEKIKERVKLYNLIEKIQIVLADMQYLPFKERQFDAVLNVGNLWYVPNYTRVCSEMIRVSRGILILEHINLINPKNLILWILHFLKYLIFAVLGKSTYPLYYRTPKQIFRPFVDLSFKIYNGARFRLLSERFLLYVSKYKR